MKIRAFPVLAAAVLLLLVALLAWEFHWRLQHNLLKPQSASPDGSLVAEARGLPRGQPPGTGMAGVYLRGRRAYLRSLDPQLVFAGDCEEVSARWFGPRRLVIECDLRSGEPRLLRDFFEGVAIELVVNRRFA